MLSQALLRLASAVSRRRMKLLLGIALLAYVACECAGCFFPPAAYSLPPSLSPSRSARARPPSGLEARTLGPAAPPHAGLRAAVPERAASPGWTRGCECCRLAEPPRRLPALRKITPRLAAGEPSVAGPRRPAAEPRGPTPGGPRARGLGAQVSGRPGVPPPRCPRPGSWRLGVRMPRGLCAQDRRVRVPVGPARRRSAGDPGAAPVCVVLPSSLTAAAGPRAGGALCRQRVDPVVS